MEQETFNRYGVSGLPHMVVLDRSGVVRSVKQGYGVDSFTAIRKEISELLRR